MGWASGKECDINKSSACPAGGGGVRDSASRGRRRSRTAAKEASFRHGARVSMVTTAGLTGSERNRGQPPRRSQEALALASLLPHDAQAGARAPRARHGPARALNAPSRAVARKALHAQGLVPPRKIILCLLAHPAAPNAPFSFACAPARAHAHRYRDQHSRAASRPRVFRHAHCGARARAC